MRPPCIALAGVNVLLGEAPAGGDPRASRLKIDARRDRRPGRPVGLRQIDPADGAGRARAATPARSRSPATISPARRGCAGALSRPQRRHRLPVLSSHSDDDGARKCRRAARTCRRGRCLERARAPDSPRSAWPIASPLSGAAFRRRAAAGRDGARVRAQPAMLLADEPTGNLDGETGQQVIDLLFALHAERGTTLLLITHDAALAAALRPRGSPARRQDRRGSTMSQP